MGGVDGGRPPQALRSCTALWRFLLGNQEWLKAVVIEHGDVACIARDTPSL